MVLSFASRVLRLGHHQGHQRADRGAWEESPPQEVQRQPHVLPPLFCSQAARPLTCYSQHRAPRAQTRPLAVAQDAHSLLAAQSMASTEILESLPETPVLFTVPLGLGEAPVLALLPSGKGTLLGHGGPGTAASQDQLSSSGKCT